MSYTDGKKYEIDMNTGALFPKLLLFSVPLMLSGVFQLLFNAADMIVIGKYASTDALAAIGGTSSLINFFVNVAIGISIGSNVIVAHYFGASRHKEIHDADLRDGDRDHCGVCMSGDPCAYEDGKR